MGIELNTNINVNAGSFSNYKSNIDVPSSPEAPEIEKPELQDVQLMSTKAAENFSDESEECWFSRYRLYLWWFYSSNSKKWKWLLSSMDR